MTKSFTIKTIAIVQSAYKTKFGVPRQSGMIRNDHSKILFESHIDVSAIEPLKIGNFIWVLFIFDQCEGNEKLQVRPPRLGGNDKIGVFATRSPFRPNNIGLSLAKIEDIKEENSQLVLIVNGLDLADQTPIIDIKPYHPIADKAWDDSDYWFGEGTVDDMEVAFPKKTNIPMEDKEFIQNVLAKDPRPAYHNDEKRVYKIELLSYEIEFQVKENYVKVIKVEKL
jgi:tRNA-Thr(GGU) m(6)t(6)A37 methyltransferase TsaA